MQTHGPSESFRVHTASGCLIVGCFEPNGAGTLTLSDGPCLGPMTLAEVPDGVRALEAFAGEDCSELHSAQWASGEWDTWTLACHVANWLDDAAEFEVDGSVWGTELVPPDADSVPGELLRLNWDLGPGGGGSPGNSDDGTYVLARLGNEYAVFSYSGGERGREDNLDAGSDEEAIVEFRKLYGASDASLSSDEGRTEA